jgi:hypothetical protein
MDSIYRIFSTYKRIDKTIDTFLVGYRLLPISQALKGAIEHLYWMSPNTNSRGWKDAM